MMTDLVIPLDQLEAAHDAIVGGKALGLGEMFRHRLPVPPGFVVTTHAYLRHVRSGLDEHIRALTCGLDETTENHAAEARIKALFLELGLDPETRAVICSAYAALGDNTAVAVRSSATAEDTLDASFAGQQETYLWVQGEDQVCTHVVKCWASLFTAQAIGYRARFDIEPENLAMAVVVQKMVDAACAGVMFTLDPMNGNRDTLYIESAFGLGEAIVRGEVSPDRYHVCKDSRQVNAQIARKQIAYQFDPSVGGVNKHTLSEDQAGKPTLSDPEAQALSELAVSIENAFGKPMDIEWAMDRERRAYLLQARPETVWSHKPTREQVEAVIGRHDDWDPLNQDSDPGQFWTTANAGEALPGVMTPLSWTTWDGISDNQINYTFYRMGLISKKELALPPVGQRKIRVFYGRCAADITLFTEPGDRIPGSSGKQIAEHIFGEFPDELESKPDRARWPIIFIKTPILALSVERRLRQGARATDRWWKKKVIEVHTLDKDSAIKLFTEARLRFYGNIYNQSAALMCAVQPLYQMLERLVEQVGIGSVDTLAGGYGDVPELGVVNDLWRASRGECSLDDVIREHGYHGPLEGELSSRIWREDPSPLRKMLSSYRARGDEASPLSRERQRRQERELLEQRLISASPFWKRPYVRWLLRTAARKIPLRGDGKNAFLQSFDVARAAARRAGQCLAEEGVLSHPDDVFMLTMDELEQGAKGDLTSLIEKRRFRREAYKQLTLPSFWKGKARPRFITDSAPGELASDFIQGIGVSTGVVEGRARVVFNPDFGEVEPDEILVAPTTDPSWSSIMFVSAGLVVDIGGAMSHAAVVARELGIPCVVNCLTGTQVIKTGDIIRINGGTGTIEMVQKAI